MFKLKEIWRERNLRVKNVKINVLLYYVLCIKLLSNYYTTQRNYLLQYAVNVEKQITYHIIQPSYFIIEVEGLAQGQGQ